MRIFISWSGEQSHHVANTLRSWLPYVIQSLDPWVSSADIDKGAAWLAEIDTELETTKHGIICVVPGNETAPWLNYEAGALAKQTGQKRVCVTLLGIGPSELSGPLKNFQATQLLAKDDVFKLLVTLNGDQSAETQLKSEQLEHAFIREWPALEAKLSEIQNDLGSSPVPSPKRPERELLEEVLAVVRTIGRDQANNEGAQLLLTDRESALIRRLRNRDAAKREARGSNKPGQFPKSTPVFHESFGVGVVVDSEGPEDAEVLSVYFDDHGMKRLLAKYAPITLFEGELPQGIQEAIEIL